MTVRLMVWGYYDKDSRTPLLGEKTLTVETYREAREATTGYLGELSGYKASYSCDGPNQNYNTWTTTR